MGDAGWDRIEQVFGEALARPEAERAAFLAAACGDEAGLRERVAALLAAHAALETRGAGGGPEFLAALDPVRVAALLAALPAGSATGAAPDAPGALPERVGRYRVERPIGRGGMGVVYLARDPALERAVALKLLPPEVAGDPAAGARLLREARAASALDHPNIATVYEVGETPDRRPFIAMAYYEGETLRERIARGPVPAREAVHIAAQVADGLAAAHDRGIVHRDIKPENVVVTLDGVVKILDFGIARAAAAGAAVTGTGAARGTVAYMSPEQTRGESVDGRTDLWSLGVLLHELLTGERPFRGEGHAALIHGIRHDPAPAVTRLKPQVPEVLGAIVGRCLEKEPAHRFPAASDVAAALRAAAGGTGPGVPRPAARRMFPLAATLSRQWRSAAAMLLLLLAVGAAGFAALRAGGGARGGGVVAERAAVLLADFTTEGTDGHLARTVTEALRLDLLQSPALRLAEPQEVAAGLRRMALDPADGLPEAAARELAQRDGLQAVIAGEVRSVAGGFVLGARIVAALDGATLAAVRETARDSLELIDAVDRLSKGVRRRLGESLHGLRAADPLPLVATASLPALHRYAEAQALSREGGDQARIAALMEEAVALDSGFAVAWRGLAATYWNLRADRARTVAATRAAYALRERLPPRDRLLIEATYFWHVLGDPRRTIEVYRRTLALEPDNFAARNNLALALLFDGRPDEAESVVREVIAPGAPALLFTTLAEALYFQHRTAAALALLDSAAAGAGGDRAIWQFARTRMLGGDGRWAEAEAVARSALREHGATPQLRAEALRGLWHLALVQGRLAEADRHFGELVALLEEAGAVDAHARALLQRADARRTLLGDSAGARAELEALLNRADLDVLTAGATLAPRIAAALAGAGDTARAARLVAAWEALPAEERGDPDTFSPELARARIDLARELPEAAAQRLQRAAEGTIQAIHYLPDLARAHALAGRPDSAIAVLERYIDFRHTRRLHRVPGYFGPALLHLGELYEATGRREPARRAYAALLDLWRGADPELGPRLEYARRRAAATGEGAGRGL
jgi:tetratricopeptide (TPR) repeat protein/predicted Ser/Thr protein kinase